MRLKLLLIVSVLGASLIAWVPYQGYPTWPLNSGAL